MPSNRLPAPALEPSEIVKDIRTLIAPGSIAHVDVLEAAMRGWSSNTRRAFRSDLRLWNEWCRCSCTEAVDATPKLVANWIRALAGFEEAGLRMRRPATIERYLVHVGWAYRMLGLVDPTRDPLVAFERRAMRKALGVKQRQAGGVRFKGDIAC